MSSDTVWWWTHKMFEISDRTCFLFYQHWDFFPSSNCLPWKSSSIKGGLPWWSSINGCLHSQAVFYQSLCSIKFLSISSSSPVTSWYPPLCLCDHCILLHCKLLIIIIFHLWYFLHVIFLPRECSPDWSHRGLGYVTLGVLHTQCSR